MKKIISLCVVLLLFNCSTDDNIHTITAKEQEILTSFQNLDALHHLQIADENEIGQRLQLCIDFVNKADDKPIANREVKFYHTNSEGNYEPLDPNNENTARLNGNATTDSQGRIYIATILPGNYGNSGDNRHIHTTVFGAKPEAYDIHFKQYIDTMGKNFVNSSDQHFLANLKYDNDSILTTFITIKVKHP